MRATWRTALPGVACALVAVVLVAGCGGSAEEKKSAGSSSQPSSAAAPAKADYDAAHTAIAELSDSYGAVYNASIAAQTAAVNHFKAHPDGALDDPMITSAEDALGKAIAKRDQLRNDLAGLAALRDPEVKKAYDTFIEKARKQDAFNDTFYAAFPLFRASLSRCLDVFQVASSPKPGTGSPSVYGRRLLTRYDAAARDCTPVLTGLASSGNELMNAYATDTLAAVKSRRDVLDQLAQGTLSAATATTRYLAATKAYNNRLDQDTSFDAQMKQLNARDEFIALNQVVEAKQKAS